MHGRVDRRHEQRGRNALARDVRHEEREPPAGEGKEVEVVAADLARRPVPSRELEARNARKVSGKDLALNRRGHLELAFDALLLDRIAVEAGRLDRRGGLVGEERQQARVGRREVEHAAVARLLVRDGEHAQPPVRHRDRDREVFLTRAVAHAVRRRVADAVVDEAALRQLPGETGPRQEELAADAALEQDFVLVEQHERALARVGQRDRAEEDLVGERREVELPAEREAEVVERLELQQPRLELELGVPDLTRQAMRRDEGAEEKAEQGGLLRGLLRGRVEDAQEPVGLALGAERHPQLALADEDALRAGARGSRPARRRPRASRRCAPRRRARAGTAWLPARRWR